MGGPYPHPFPAAVPLYALCAFAFCVQLYLAYRFSLSMWAG